MAAVLAVGAGLATAAMVERPAESPVELASVKPGENVGPLPSLGARLIDIDRSLTTAATRNPGARSSGNNESLRLALSSMQRQINALSARNDRLEQQLRALRANTTDSMLTGTVPASAQSAQDAATDALRALSESESSQADQAIAGGLNDMRQMTQQISGIDLGSGISFDTLRARWLEIQRAQPAALDGLEARAVLRDGAQGLIAHLIVGPLSSQDAASQLCESIGKADISDCRPVPFEGQPL